MRVKSASCWVAARCALAHLCCLSSFLLLSGSARAGSPPAQPTATAVMLSDLHFDPYRDPAKLPGLRTADIAEWRRILDAPASATQPADFAALQKTCKARGTDSSWQVVHDSLQAARTQQPKPLFVTVSGDLLTHNFDCRMRTLAPSITPEELSSFAGKTIAFVALELRKTFPGTPLYLALGNNDSGCTNYHQSANSKFLRETAQTFATSASAKSTHGAVLPVFDQQDDYSVHLPAPMQQTRLIVLQDVFQAPDSKDCSGASTAQAASAQIAWLRARLIMARKAHQHVWVMAHIPPGVDTYASFHKYIATPEKLCPAATLTPMLNSEALADTLTEFADVVRLALFAHTHMDEVKLLHNPSGGLIPAKLLPSISPVNGNSSAFTVAYIQPRSAILADYTVFVASAQNPGAWSEEYRYSLAYNKPDFSAESVSQLTSSLARDRNGTEEPSQTYRQWFFPGDQGEYAHGLKQIWPSYACAASENGGAEFTRCMCPSAKDPAAALLH